MTSAGHEYALLPLRHEVAPCEGLADWRAGYAGRVGPGACSMPGPALSCAAGNSGVRSTGGTLTAIGNTPENATAQHFCPPASPRGLLEPDAWKRARPVLRGAGHSNVPGLPGQAG